MDRTMADLFSNAEEMAYTPRPAWGFTPRRIVLSKGSRTTPGRRRFADAVCAASPDAEVLYQPDVPHNRVDLGEADPLAALRRGKRTLVLGRTPVRRPPEPRGW